ncbi:MAG: Spy/CpxP family protein refolding chaperone [Rudaea sp.]|uniref:hypothetical protein n=1 Tax=Rudaea sp. TaxID=2136325 RepID=UPI0039E32CD3
MAGNRPRHESRSAMTSLSHHPRLTRRLPKLLCKPALALAMIAAAASAHPPANARPEQSASQNCAGVVEHVNCMLDNARAEINPTAEQKTKIAALTQQAKHDLAQFETQGDDGHARIFNLLMQATIDHNAIETEHAAHMKLHEQASHRTLQFLFDVAETLTPTQRKALSDYFAHSGHTD